MEEIDDLKEKLKNNEEIFKSKFEQSIQ